MTQPQPLYPQVHAIRKLTAGCILGYLILTCQFLLPDALLAPAYAQTKWNPGHYFKFGSFKPDEVDTRMKWLGSNPHIIGLSFGFGWTDIESTKDNYNWSLIDEMLAKAEQYDKQLIVRFAEGSRSSALDAVPLYVLNDPIYEGGVAPLYKDSAKTIQKGWQTKIWVPAVRERMKALMKAFGERYDDNPRIEAFFLPETSRARVGGVTTQDLTDAMAEIQGARLNLMPKTIMARNMNWLGSGTSVEYLESIAEEIARVGGGIGHPDTAQHYLYNSTDGLGTPGYKVERMYKDQVAIMPSANTSDLKAEDTAEWIYDYLVNTQEAHYILWNVTWSYTNKYGVNKHSRDWVEEILQVLNANNGYIRTECPPSLAPCVTDGSLPDDGGGQTPYGGSAHVIPGLVEAEDFDNGGKGVAYHDTTAGNNGGAYRPDENVDLQSANDTGGGYNVGWTGGGEWLEYTVDVAQSGTYTLEARVAAPNNSRSFRVEVDGTDVTGSVAVPNTGGWQNYQTIQVPGVSLNAGLRVMRVVLETGGANYNFFNFVFEAEVDDSFGVQAEYFDFTENLSVLPDLSGRTADVVRVEPGINQASVSTAWDGLGPEFADTFAVRYRGQIWIAEAGTYTFYLTSDDGSRLLIDGQVVVDHDGIHGMTEQSGSVALDAGDHVLEVVYFENQWGAGINLSWSGAGISQQTVPKEVLIAEVVEVPPEPILNPGVQVEYFDFTTELSQLPDLNGRTADVVRVEAQIDQPSVSEAWLGLGSEFADTFAARYRGQIRIPETGTYTFYLSSDDGSRLLINGQVIIDHDGVHGMTERSGSVDLTAGDHILEVFYFENQWGAGINLSWSGPGISKQTVPTEVLIAEAEDVLPPPPPEPEPELYAGIKAEYFDVTGNLSFIPDLSGRTADVVRVESQIDHPPVDTAWIGLGEAYADTFAARYSGIIRIAEAGSYTFYLSSDDGSRLSIDGQVVINHDGVHGMTEQSGSMNLTVGDHNLEVIYFENLWGAGINLSWAGPGISKATIPGGVLLTDMAPEEGDPPGTDPPPDIPPAYAPLACLSNASFDVPASTDKEGNLYYVSANGSSSASGTSPSSPWNIDKVKSFNFQTGDNIYFKCGDTFRGFNQVVVTWSGTSSNPAVIGAYRVENGQVITDNCGDLSKPVFDGENTAPSNEWTALWRIDGDYVHFENMRVINSAGGAVYVNGRDVRVAKTDIVGTYIHGIYFYATQGGIAEGNTVTLTSQSEVAEPSRPFYIGIAAGWTSSGGSNGVIIRKNIVFHNYGEGMGAYRSDNTTIEDNISYGNRSANIYISASSGSLVQRNLVYGTTNPIGQRWGGGEQTPGGGIWLVSEHHTNRSIADNIVRDNLIAGTGHAMALAIAEWSGGTTTKTLRDNQIYRNTYVDNYINFTRWNGTFTNNVVHNNVFVCNSGADCTQAGSSSNGMTFFNNHWSNNQNIHAGAGDTIGPVDLAKASGWQELVGGDLSSCDFRILSGVPADRGVNLVDTTFSTEGTYTTMETPPPPASSAHAIPGRIEAEDFDSGGEGVSYHDTDSENVGGAYRAAEGVDLKQYADGTVIVGWIRSGEWLEYTVSMATSGTYTLSARVAAPSSGKIFHVEIDGNDVSGSVSVPNTGNWHAYEIMEHSGIELPAGEHALRIVFDTGSMNMDFVEFSESLPTTVITAGSTARNVTHGWYAVSWSESFTDPMVLAGLASSYGGDAAGVRLQDLSANGVSVRVEEEASGDNETNHTTEDVHYLVLEAGAVYDDAGTIIGEAGSVTQSQPDAGTWHTVQFTQNYSTPPVVLMNMVTFNGSDPSHIRLRNVTATSFQYQIEEWDYLDGGHTTETMHYIAIKPGTHTVNGKKVRAATVSQVNQNWKTVSYGTSFGSAPAVISQPQTYNDAAAIVTRQRNVGTGSFEVRVQEEEKGNSHGSENVGFIAVEN